MHPDSILTPTTASASASTSRSTLGFRPSRRDQRPCSALTINYNSSRGSHGRHPSVSLRDVHGVFDDRIPIWRHVPTDLSPRRSARIELCTLCSTLFTLHSAFPSPQFPLPVSATDAPMPPNFPHRPPALPYPLRLYATYYAPAPQPPGSSNLLSDPRSVWRVLPRATHVRARHHIQYPLVWLHGGPGPAAHNPLPFDGLTGAIVLFFSHRFWYAPLSDHLFASSVTLCCVPCKLKRPPSREVHTACRGDRHEHVPCLILTAAAMGDDHDAPMGDVRRTRAF